MPSVAIVECLTLHTEVMGAAASLFHEYGYDVTLFYNVHDPWHMIDVFKERQPWIQDVKSWLDLFSLPHTTFDVVVLNTSDEWRRNRMCGRYLDALNREGRLCVIHHDICYLPMFPQYQRYVGPTPAYGIDHWIIPMYNAPQQHTAIVIENSVGLPCLTCVGSLDSKDREDVEHYMQHGGKVANYVRYPAKDFIEKYPLLFECHENMNGRDLMNALQSTIGNGKGFMWFPIVQTTNYATSKYSGSLTLGLDVNALLVMPRVLQDMMHLPHDGVITYETSITESDTLSELQKAMRDPAPYLNALYEWKVQMWEHNKKVWDSIMVPK